MTTGRKGQSSVKVRRDLGITQETAWHLAHHIRRTFATDPGQFEGPVEVDEAYFGGKKKNKPLSQRRLEECRIADKVAGERSSGPAHPCHGDGVADTEVGTIQEFVKKGVHQGAMLLTDEATAYRGMPEFGHESVRHSVFKSVWGQARANGLESFWPILKRGYVGTSNHMSRKHLGRYVAEFAGRHNLWDANTAHQMEAIASEFRSKRLRYAELTA